MEVKECRIRSYNGDIERSRVEDLERRCDVGPSQHLFADTKGDPMCRIRNSPLYIMLVAELGNELVGVIQGTIKFVTVHNPSKGLAKVGYILGLRVCPLHRRQGIASTLVRHLEDWFISNRVDYAYMATEKDNQASVNLFTNRLGFARFRTPAILVQPVSARTVRLSPTIEIAKLGLDQAESLYRRFMGSADFFPDDVDKVLANKLSLGTWVAYPRVCPNDGFGPDGRVPDSWAMASVWDSGGIFKLRVGKSTLSCSVYEAYSRLMDRVLPCFAVSVLPDFFGPFGFYFMYGLHRQGPGSGRLVRALCRFVQNLAAKSHDCKVVVAEVGGGDAVRMHVPHWRLLSCPEDLWCVKALKSELKDSLDELTNKSPTRALFVDPREV
ncbi:Aminoglycoside N(6')-acetyltransferase [Bertholletia excelsa]